MTFSPGDFIEYADHDHYGMIVAVTKEHYRIFWFRYGDEICNDMVDHNKESFESYMEYEKERLTLSQK